MRKVGIVVAICLLSLSLMTMEIKIAFAEGYLKVIPGSAFVGSPYRRILIYVEAWDSAWNVAWLALWAENVPRGAYVTFDPSYVGANSYIASTMKVDGGTANAGTYYTTIVAEWTNVIGQKWQRRTTFTLQIKTAPEGSWTLNPYLTNPYKDKWYPQAFMWNCLGPGSTPVNSHTDHYVLWNTSGRVSIKATDFSPDGWGEAGDFTQGRAWGSEYANYQPPAVQLVAYGPQLTFRATATSYGTTWPNDPLSWTGIKFDAWATNTKDNRKLYVEMYFVRTGLNLAWFGYPPFNDIEVVRTLSTDIDDYMVDIRSFSDHAKIEVISGVAYFTIDLTFFFKRACDRLAEYAWLIGNNWNGKTISDFSIVKAGPCLEAGYVANGIYAVQCSASFSYIELKGSYLADINCDGKVDIMDIVVVSSSYGSVFGSSSYKPNADINLDKVIDIFDLASVSKYYGKTTFP